jgi:hypothetical protein
LERAMKDLNNQSRLATFLLITLGCCMAASAGGDVYINTQYVMQ